MKEGAQAPPYEIVLNCTGEIWNPDPILKWFRTKWFDLFPNSSPCIDVGPCGVHTKTVQFVGKKLFSHPVTGALISIHSKACYTKKAKAEVDVAIQIMTELGQIPPSRWQIEAKHNVTHVRKEHVTTGPASSAVVSSEREYSRVQADARGKHSPLSAMEALKQKGLLDFGHEVTANSVNGWTIVFLKDTKVTYQASFTNDFQHEWCVNKCMKLLLRKASVVCEEAFELYRALDTKQRFVQGRIFELEEGNDVEFKGGANINAPMSFDAAKKHATKDETGKTVCGFLNGYLTGSDGGSIYLGIHDQGPVTGIEDVANINLDMPSNTKKAWTIVEFFVQKDQEIAIGDAVCAVRNDAGVQYVVRTEFAGTVISLHRDGKTPVIVKKAKDVGYLARVKLPTTASSSILPEEAHEQKRVGVVTGVELTRPHRDELRRLLCDRLLQSIEPKPVNLIAVFLHPVDTLVEPDDDQPYDYGHDVPAHIVTYIRSLEQQLRTQKAELKKLQGRSGDFFVVEIRVVAGNALHFFKHCAYERLVDAGSTHAISIVKLKEIIVSEHRRKK